MFQLEDEFVLNSLNINQELGAENKSNNKSNTLQMKFHQELSIQKSMNLIHNGYHEILLGLKCRAGKSFIIAGLILEYEKKFNHVSALIISPIPKETMSQFTTDLFLKYPEFKNYYINILTSKKNILALDFKQMKKKSCIFIISKQMLQAYLGSRIIKKLKEIRLNFMFFDETHFSGASNISENIFEAYNSIDTVNVYLTGTFHKVIDVYKIPLEACIFWTIEDEQLCKKRDVSELIKRHGPLVKKLLLSTKSNLEDHIENELSFYDSYPDMILLTPINITKLSSETAEVSCNILFSLKHYRCWFVNKKKGV